MKQKTLVVSLDALGAEDRDIFMEQPHIRAVIDNGSFLARVKSVNPTLTYPAHTTISTGRSPASHGIVNNIKVQPNRMPPDWYWHEKEIHGDTLFRAAARMHKKVGAIFWPVSAGAKLHWNVAEIWPNRKWQTQKMMSLLNSTPGFTVRMAKKHGHLLNGILQPQLDDFAYACAQEILNHEPWDMLFVHLTDIDAHKHRYGNRSKEVTEAIRRTDQRVGGFIETLQRQNALQHTNIILLSDHSQRDIRKTLRLNQIFYRHGLLNVRLGKINQWQVFAHTAEGLTMIYSKDNSPEGKRFLRELLEDIQKTYDGIEAIYSQEEEVQMGADPHCQFLVTAKPGVVFSNGLEGEVFGLVEKGYRANHGYRNDLPNYEAIFAGYGPRFKAGVCVEDVVEMIDIGPTIAEAAHLRLRKPEGQPRWEILQDE